MNTTSGRRWLVTASAIGFAAVAFGAFAAHGLRARLTPELLATFETAVRYQMYHALALALTAILLDRADSRCLHLAAWAFLTGVVVFSGSLYALALTGERRCGAVTPFGGAAFLVGWAALAVGAHRPKRVT